MSITINKKTNDVSADSGVMTIDGVAIINVNDISAALAAEAATFFGSTDITGAEAQALTGGGETSLHSHAGGGGGEDAFTAESTPAVTPVATGTDSIAIAEAASAEGDLSVAIGVNAVAGTAASNKQHIAIGWNATADSIPDDCIAIGSNTNATGNSSVAIGDGADSSNSGSLAFGFLTNADGSGTLALGFMSDSGGGNSLALGYYADAPNKGQISFAGGTGSHQSIKFICHGATSNATPKKINPDGGTTNRMILTANTCWRFRIEVAASTSSALSDYLGTTLVGTIRRDNASGTILVGTVDELNRDEEGSAAWVVAVTADNTLEAIEITVTGEASHTINWTAVVHISESR